MTNIVDPNQMPYFFYLGLHCLLRPRVNAVILQCVTNIFAINYLNTAVITFNRNKINVSKMLSKCDF